MSRPAPTIAQLPPTGLDRGARMLIVEALDPQGYGDVLPSTLVQDFFAGSWADLADYLDGLERTGNKAAAAGMRLVAGSKSPIRYEGAARAVLTFMPDGDYLTAVEVALHTRIGIQRGDRYVQAVNGICVRRGVPYRIAQDDRFEWSATP